MHLSRLLAAALCMGTPALAEVKSSSPTGFQVERRAVVPATPAQVYAQIGRIGEWWDLAHSYSGKAENLKLELRGGGCFCETLNNGGSVEHLRVVYADPDSEIRLHGSLGPFQSMAVTGTLIWSFKPASGGTEIVQSYVVSGPVSGGADKIAPLVDEVLGGHFERLRQKLGG
jgi:hypothetical protein